MNLPNKISLYVHATMPDRSKVLVGRLLSRNLNSFTDKEGFFKYEPSYLNNPQAYPLDPVRLPLKPINFKAPNRETGIHQVFEDSLPDSWGLQILARKGGVEYGRCSPAHFLSILGGSGLGRLSFFSTKDTFALEDGSLSYDNISLALEEAVNLESSIDTDTSRLQHILACGSSAGGARPKILNYWNDNYWIAKFSSIRDISPDLNISLEQAGMTLAKQCGLEVPSIKRQTIADREILFIKRFDITPKNGRNALVSFKTLLGTSDPSSVSYYKLAEIIAKYSHQPQVDLELLFRQMIVNVALINGDDHLQNFAMLHTAGGWELSPAYDIVPNIHQSSQLIPINGKFSGIGHNDLFQEGLKFNLSSKQTEAILKDVISRFAGWEKIFDHCRVPQEHTQQLRKKIKSSVARIQR